MGKKIFVGRLPQEASSEDLRQYFGRFGRILDVYVPKVRNDLYVSLKKKILKMNRFFIAQGLAIWFRTPRELVIEDLVL